MIISATQRIDLSNQGVINSLGQVTSPQPAPYAEASYVPVGGGMENNLPWTTASLESAEHSVPIINDVPALTHGTVWEVDPDRPFTLPSTALPFFSSLRCSS